MVAHASGRRCCCGWIPRFMTHWPDGPATSCAVRTPRLSSCCAARWPMPGGCPATHARCAAPAGRPAAASYRQPLTAVSEAVTCAGVVATGCRKTGRSPTPRQSASDEFGRCGTALREAEERAEVPRGRKARQVQAGEARLEGLVEHREPVGNLDAVEHSGEIRHPADIRLVARGAHG